jgi:hypothetical protein
LLRNFTVVMANIADGVTPARHLRVLRPYASFAVTKAGDDLLLDPASYHRYDDLAAALASVEPDGAARLYSTLKPRLTEAYRELGHPDTPVDNALERAIVVLLQTPVVEGQIHLRAVKGTGYGFTDPALESLSAAQKQLLRTGPANMKVIQNALRSLARALGIPPQRLPAPRTVVETH